MKGDRLYLIHIKECIEQIGSYTVDGRDAFMGSRMIQDAVIRNFEVIGEATKRLSMEVRQGYPEVRWRDVAGFHDVLIHDYLGVDVDQVWIIVETTMPILKRQITEILQSLE